MSKYQIHLVDRSGRITALREAGEWRDKAVEKFKAAASRMDGKTPVKLELIEREGGNHITVTQKDQRWTELNRPW